ncbi:MAG: 1,4-dihydroxy-2-naphthoate octaprenyltransferase [Anaerolineaceae bacterium]|nr:1,4-dihydroxy-2-naphthoate octaprenyltransferase [Anaerolineaceae bacterium]
MSTAGGSHKPRLLRWFWATRPRIFTATFVPFALVAVLAITDGAFHLLRFLAALLTALLLQAAANLINEYADHRRGSDAYKRAGQGMTIQRRELPAREVLALALMSLVGGILLGLYLVAITDLRLIWIGLLGTAIVIGYTAGPFPLAYHSLGELAVAIGFGPLCLYGGYYVVTGSAKTEHLWLSLPIATMVAAILHANNLRDLNADRAAGKWTLAARFGRRFARIEYVALVSGSYLLLIALVAFGVAAPGALLALITGPQAYRLQRIFWEEEHIATLHAAQTETAVLHGRFGFAFSLGWLLLWAGSSLI